MSSGRFVKTISSGLSEGRSCGVQVSSDFGRGCFASIWSLIVVMSQEPMPLPKMREQLSSQIQRALLVGFALHPVRGFTGQI
jgi:hypothetical protein